MVQDIYFGINEVTFTKNEFKEQLRDENIRSDLNLAAPLPTSIKLNSEGITAYTTVSDQHFARMDYRGLYIQNGALDIRTGTALNRGITLNGNGLKGYDSTGMLTYSLDTNGKLQLYGGKIDIRTVNDNKYRGVVFDSYGLRGYMQNGTETFNLNVDGSLTLNGGYLSIINGLQRSHLETSMVDKWDSAEENAIKAAEDADDDLREDLRLTAPLPTQLLLNGNGITAYANGDTSRYARMDYRGLYVQNGAIDIRTGSSLTQGVVLNASGLKGYNSSGTRTFELNSSNGSAYFSGEVYVGNSSAYTRIIQNYVEVYGQYVRTWGYSQSTINYIKNLLQTNPNSSSLDSYRQRVTLELKEGRMRINNPKNGSLYYSDYGISTWAEGTGAETSSGVIEFFSKKFGNVNGLALYSSGNISLNSSYSTGSTIYLNAMGGNYNSSASVIVGFGDSSGSWGTLKAGKIYISDGYGGSELVASKNYVDKAVSENTPTINTSSFVTYSDLRDYAKTSGATIGSWEIGSSNINATSGNIKMGAASGNIVITGSLTQGSNRSIKKNIKSFEKSGLDIINSAQIREFNYLNDVDTIDMPRVGLIVDEAPLEVLDINDGGYGVLAFDATWINWKATQELSEQLDKEKAKNELLTNELNDLRSEIEYIKAILNK